MIDRDSLINPPLPRDSQNTPSQSVNPQDTTPIEVVQDLLRPFVEDLGKVREQLGAERVLREQAERERDELAAELEATRDALRAPRMDEAGESGTETPAEDTGQPRRSWWKRFFGFE